MSEHCGAGFFGEREAAVYDDHLAEMFDPAVVTPVVEMLAGAGRRWEPFTSLSRSHVSIYEKS
jgi:hypothetical protein